ncbi:MAG TPA: helix-turn-helix domain-containing protein [Chloroflexota bacterium]
MGRMLTPAEVADRLRIGRETVYRHIRAGTIEAARIGRSYRVDEAVLNDFVASARGLVPSLSHDRGGVDRRREGISAKAVQVPGRLTPQQRAQALELVARWGEEANDPEHAESWDFLRKALDEDRLSDRPLFT